MSARDWWTVVMALLVIVASGLLGYPTGWRTVRGFAFLLWAALITAGWVTTVVQP